MKTNLFTALLVASIFIFISLWLVNFHEIYRDEAQTWLLSRDSSSISELLWNLKYEGTTGLWHLILYPLTRFFETPEVMQNLHVVIAGASIFVMFKWSPFNIAQKILLSFSYFLFYEYSIIARSYAVSVLLIFIVCSLYPNRRRYPIITAISLFLLSYTNIFGLIFSISLFFTILFEELCLKIRDNYFQNLSFKQLTSIVLILTGFTISIITIIPTSDGAFATQWHYNFEVDRLKYISQSLPSSYFPIPIIKISFWNTIGIFYNSITKIVFVLITVGFICSVSIFLIKRPSSFFLYTLSSFGLILFFYTKYWTGEIRHSGFLFISLISSLWIYKDCINLNFFKFPRGVESYNRNLLNKFFTLILFVQFLTGIFANYIDYKYNFHPITQVVQFIKKNKLSNHQMILYHYIYSPTLAISIQGKNIYNPSIQNYQTFVKWDWNRLKEVDFKDLLYASNKLSSKNDRVILILNKSSSAKDIPKIENFKNIGSHGEIQYKFKKIFETSQPNILGQNFVIYKFVTKN